MRKILSLIMFLLALSSLPASAQRIQQTLGRGVVAVMRSNNVLVSWRKMAQEPETCTYNLYKRTAGGGSYTKVNASPLTKTNYQTTLSAIPYNTDLAVSVVVDGVEGAISNPFTFKQQAWSNVYADIDFEKKVINPATYRAKFCWPADLDGDGEYDFIVDRLSTNTDSTNHKLQAYLRDGTCLWTVDMGPNVRIDEGQNDMVLAYDINDDGRAEVIIKSSDGTRFWDKTNNTWGKYAFGKDTGDTDGDGIIDYTTSTTRNPPFYVSVIDGMTGAELSSAELDYSKVTDGVDTYTRDNRADYMTDGNGTEYAFMSGHFAICYFDGIHPSLAMECLDRTKSTQAHHNYVFAFGYDWYNGQPSNWHHYYTWSRNDKTPWPAEFHQLRVCDVDGDGIDEMLQGGYGVNPVKNMVFSAGIGHGDRYRVSDIDPDRPGLETYAIQQTNLMGQLLYDAATGTHIKEWYLSSVADVGRGECMDVTPDYKGYEIYSTMPNLYDCKGNTISEGDTPFPYEGVWWDGDLGREVLGSPGGSNYGTNALIADYDQVKGNRQIQFSSESGWAVHASSAIRPLFYGDIAGDWREEVVLAKQNETSSTGFVAYSTNQASDYSLYCLQEDPHYRLDCTTRGYYQSPNTDFYLGYDMPSPPLPPSMVTDLRWKSGTEWTLGFEKFNESTSENFAAGKSVVFDISGSNTGSIAINSDVNPANVYFMAPKNHDYTFSGTGKINSTGEIWKSMQGTVTLNNDITATNVKISEGTLAVNGNINGKLWLRAKGTLAGNAVVNDSVAFEGGLNYEGCRLSPAGSDYGTITFNKSIVMPGKVYVESNLQTSGTVKCDLIKVNGDLTLNGTNTFTIDPAETAPAMGEYTLAECTGTLTANASNITILGMVGMKYEVEVKDNKIVLNVKGTRDPATVTWTGAKSSNWDYKTDNFTLSGGETSFVSNDKVIFNDLADKSTVNMTDSMVTAGMTINNEKLNYTFSGAGGISGEGGLTKTGAGSLTLNTANNYTGVTTISGGKVVVGKLAFGGLKSSFGASSAAASNLLLDNCTLSFGETNAATDRSMTLTDSVTMNVASGTTSLNGRVIGGGVLIKTGSGQLNFNYAGVNNLSGFVLNGGIVAQGSWQTYFCTAGKPFIFKGGQVNIIKNTNMKTIPEFNYAAEVVSGTNIINSSFRCYIGGSFSGSGALKIIIGGTRSDIYSDFSKFTGALTLAAGDGTCARFNQPENLSGAIVELAANTSISHYEKGGKSTLPTLTSKLGALKSLYATSSLADGIYEVGYNNQNAVFAGKLLCSKVTKYGTGMWTLTGMSSTSSIVVQAGVLYSMSAATTGSLTLNADGIYTGTGSFGSVVLNGGTLRPIVPSNVSVGDEVTLFNATGTITGTYVIDNQGIEWDDSELLSAGKLKVKALTTGISSLTVNSPVDVYSVDGIKLRSGIAYGKALDSLQPGVYVINGVKIRK